MIRFYEVSSLTCHVYLVFDFLDIDVKVYFKSVHIDLCVDLRVDLCIHRSSLIVWCGVGLRGVLQKLRQIGKRALCL